MMGGREEEEGIYKYPEMVETGGAGGARIERTRASNYQGVEAPWFLALARKWPPDRETKHQKMPRDGETHNKGEADTQGRLRTPRQANPPGANRDMGEG